MKKRILSILLALCLCLSIIPMSSLSTAAKTVDDDLVETGFSPDNFKAQIKKVSIGAPITGSDGKKYLPVDVHFFAAENLSDNDMVYFLEGYLKAQLKGGGLAESIRGLGMTLMGPLKTDVPLESNMWNWDWTPYETGGGQGVIKYNVPLLEESETQSVEQSQATGMTEVNGVKVGDEITLQNETVVNTNNIPEQIVQELFPDGPSVFSDPVTFVVEKESNYPKEITVGETPTECTHENTETEGKVLNVKGSVTIDGKTTGVVLVKETDECTDCHQKKTTKVYRLRFKSRVQMYKYLSGKYAKLSNGKKVHFKGKYEKVERVYWNKKRIKVSKTYNKKKGSVILDFTDEFLASVEDGTHELMVCNGDEFTAMTVTVQDHEMIEIGAFDVEDHAEITADQYYALMQECEDEDIEVVDCDLDAFYAGGFMVNADDTEVTMNLSADTLSYTGDPIDPPAAVLTSDMGVEYTEGEDYTLTYYQIVDGVDGEPIEVEVDPEQLKDIGTYKVVATPTRNGVLFGEVWATFSVEKPTLLGDIDGDGEVSVIDATLVQRKLANMEVPVFNDDAADIDGDGELGSPDATLLRRWLSEMEVTAKVGEPIC